MTEVGCLRCDLLFAYRASPPHCGTLLQQQQTQASTLILWLTGHFYHTAAREKVNFACERVVTQFAQFDQQDARSVPKYTERTGRYKTVLSRWYLVL